MQMFRAGKLWRGQEIAERLEVSLRTIYRDIDTLVASGVAIEGERGVGYILREPIFLPPLTLSVPELEALHLGMEILRKTASAEMVEAAEQLLIKVEAVLPSTRQGRNHLGELSVYTPGLKVKLHHLAGLKQAISSKHIVKIDYETLSGKTSSRRIQPLQIEYWGRVWTCTAWCELREDFRVFRIDKITACRATIDTFRSEPGKTYKDYLATFDARDKKN
ncbi:MAG: YafY family transcriptional regulator [Rhizobiaceae bacterium]|nr:YafY family transcriptional regulator [Rhizobiaceae bacterium]